MDPPTGTAARQEVGRVHTSDRRSELRHQLWNDAPEKIGPGGATNYQSTVLEQYKLYVEMADRVSARRGLANSFFLMTLNTGIITLTVGKTPPEGKPWLTIPLVATLPVFRLVLPCSEPATRS
jgi:hypothetical protein